MWVSFILEFGLCAVDPLLQDPACDSLAMEEVAQSAKIKTLESKLKVTRNTLYRSRKKKASAPQKTLSVSERINNLIKELSHFLKPNAVLFIRSQLRAVTKKKKGYRWTEKDKTTCLAIFHARFDFMTH